eukprot:m.246388 g.246388  ORF g.246388 m.246388 type:complete len:112 (+) comp15377_c0_seq14:717-1052(+)
MLAFTDYHDHIQRNTTVVRPTSELPKRSPSTDVLCGNDLHQESAIARQLLVTRRLGVPVSDTLPGGLWNQEEQLAHATHAAERAKSIPSGTAQVASLFNSQGNVCVHICIW